MEDIPTATLHGLPDIIQQYIIQMQANNNTLNETIAAMTNDRPSQAPKLPDPRKFDGSRNTRALKDYLYDVQQHFKNEPKKFMLEETKVRFAGSYLIGTAKQWFQNLDESGRPPWYNFNTFAQELEKCFAELDPLAYWQRRWDALEQRGSVNQYLADFTTVAAQLDLTEQVKYHHFWKGLRPNVKDQLALLPRPDGFDKLVQIANQIDARFYERSRGQGPPRNYAQQQNHRRYQPNGFYHQAPQASSGASSDAMQIDNMQRQQPRPYTNSSTHSPRNGNGNSQNNHRNGSQAGIVCFKCGKPGHKANNCFSPRQQTPATGANSVKLPQSKN